MKHVMNNPAAARAQLQRVIGLAAVIHVLLFVYDITSGFAPFRRGDRAGWRMDTMLQLLEQPSGDWLRFATQAPMVPGEYAFQIVPYLLGGPGLVIVLQVVLMLAAIGCITHLAQTLFTWPRAGLVAGLVYTLLPQSLVYPHQFVTEAICAPFCVFFLYGMARYFREGRWGWAVGAGLALGVAAFSRPSLALIAVAMLLLTVVYWRVHGGRRFVGVVAACGAAAIPLAIWVAMFTSITGQLGYANTVASLGWNLRSKVWLTQTGNGLEKPPEVQKYTSYAQLYDDTGSITVGRFLEIASQNPGKYVKAVVSDASILLFKGNSTKVTVDYLGIGRDDGIKEWRNVWEAGGAGGLARWALQHPNAVMPFALEIVVSVFTLVCGLAVVGFTVFALLAPTRVARVISPERFGALLAATALLVAVGAAAQMVDRAQARLRSPAEGAMVITLGLGLAYLRGSRGAAVRRREGVAPAPAFTAPH